jgi:F0F1-type ATP synthase assembly protein I
MCFGLAIGVLFGAMFGNIPLGLCFGIAIGVGAGVIFGAYKKKP